MTGDGGTDIAAVKLLAMLLVVGFPLFAGPLEGCRDTDQLRPAAPGGPTGELLLWHRVMGVFFTGVDARLQLLTCCVSKPCSTFAPWDFPAESLTPRTKGFMKYSPATCDSPKTGGVEQIAVACEGILGKNIRPGLFDREVQELEMKPDSELPDLPELGYCPIGELANISSNSSEEEEVELWDSSTSASSGGTGSRTGVQGNCWLRGFWA